MVGHHKVIVNRLGNAHKADIAANMGTVISQLADGKMCIRDSH